MAIIDAPGNIATAILLAVAVAAMLLGPGLVWNGLRPERRLPSAYIPVPGLLYLCLVGAGLWVVHPDGTTFSGFLVATPGIASVAGLIWLAARRRIGAAILGDQGWMLSVWLALVVMAFAVGVNRLPVAGELYANTTLPARMVTPPPDHIGPYYTAVYFFHGYDGRERSDAYFQKEWSVTSRGPLAPFAVLSLMHAFHARPSDLPDVSATAWPVTMEGAFLARLAGWMTNALVVLGVGHLMFTLGASAHAQRFAVAWTGLAPAVFLNTVYVWPKMLAGFFLLIAIAEVSRRRWALGAMWTAFGWLSHPLALLFAPGLGLFVLWRARSAGNTSTHIKAMWSAGFRFGAALLLTALPWLLYKLWLGRHDMFLDYLLAAGNVPERAQDFASWAHFRWTSFWYTAVPGSLMIGGDLLAPVRWHMHYSQTLPGNLGMAMFLPAYAAMMYWRATPAQSAYRICVIFIPFLLMVVSWGWSSDGLGRNSLQPLIPLIITFTAVTWRMDNRLWSAGLAITLLEGRWLEITSMTSAAGFVWANVPISSWIAWGVSTGAAVFILRSAHPTDRFPPPTVYSPDRP